MLQAFLLGCVAFIGKCDLATGTNMIQRPIVLGPLVGLILGDLQTGIVVGGVLGTAFAIKTGRGAEIAFTMAFPIALLAQAIDNVIFSIVRPFMGRLADKYAEQGNARAISVIHMVTGFITCTVLFLITFFGYALGSSQMETIVNAIPKVITNGLSIACGLLPGIGFAMLARMIMNKEVVPFFFLGFVLSAYFKVPVVGIAIIGLIAVFLKVDFSNNNNTLAVEGGEEDEDF